MEISSAGKPRRACISPFRTCPPSIGERKPDFHFAAARLRVEILAVEFEDIRERTKLAAGDRQPGAEGRVDRRRDAVDMVGMGKDRIGLCRNGQRLEPGRQVVCACDPDGGEIARAARPAAMKALRVSKRGVGRSVFAMAVMRSGSCNVRPDRSRLFRSISGVMPNSARKARVNASWEP